MKRNILIMGMLALLVLGGEDLLAQRNGRGQRGDRQGGRKEVRGDNGANRNSKRNRNGNRTVRVVDRKYISYDGYREGSYFRYGSQRDYNRRASRRAYRPSKRHIWIAGHWKFNRRLNRDIWLDGRWTIRQQHHRWVDGHYDRRGGARIWIPGCWVSF